MKGKPKGISRGKGQGKSKPKKCKKQPVVEGAKKEEKADVKDEEHRHDNENASSDTASCHEDDKGSPKVAAAAEESGVLAIRQAACMARAVEVLENIAQSLPTPPTGYVPRQVIVAKDDRSDRALKVPLPPPVLSVPPRQLRPELPPPIWHPPHFNAPPPAPFSTPPPPNPVASRTFAATKAVIARPPRDLVRATKPDLNVNLATLGTPNPEKVVKHPLANKWTLWWYKEIQRTDYTLCQKPVLTVSTVEDFWALFHNVMPASELSNGQDYSLFKEGIKPLWEDPRNRQGGRWLYAIGLGSKRRATGRVDECWRDALLLLIGEDYGNEKMRSMVNGAVINLRKLDKLSIWMDAIHEQEVIEFGKVFKDAMGMMGMLDCPFKFEVHEDWAKRKGSTTKCMHLI